MKRVALGLLFASHCAMAVAQNSPPNSAADTRSPDALQPLSPEDSFGLTYGTNNLMHAPVAAPRDFLQEQNQREQPPTGAEPFSSHVRNNSLLDRAILALQANPNLDPTSVVVANWNLVALDMTSIDHTTAGSRISYPGLPAGTTVPVFEATYGEQFGPPRSSRALAIVHLAMFEAVNVIDHRYASWTPLGTSSNINSGIVKEVGGQTAASQGSTAAAAHEAAYRTLVALYPRKRSLLDAAKVEIGILVSAQAPSLSSASTVSPEQRISLGEQIGAAAANAVLLARATDGSEIPSATNRCLKLNSAQPDGTVAPDRLCREAYFIAGKVQPTSAFNWTFDPVSLNALILGENWGNVNPWVLSPHELVTDKGLVLGGSVKPTPTQTSPEFLESLQQKAYGDPISDPHGAEIWNKKYGVRYFGGFNINLSPEKKRLSPSGAPRDFTATDRMPDQETFGRFWGYDATALLCAPPRLYNMVATSYWHQKMEAAAGGPHAGVDFARYLALVNVVLAEAGITSWDAKFRYHIARPITYIHATASSPGTEPKLTFWTPLGQAGSNGAPDGVTPPFPSYPSGHAVFGGALFKMVADITAKNLADPATNFSFVSDEFNGHTFGADGKLRKYIEAKYPSLGFAEWENAESRIWLGIHWQMDADDGSRLGEEIAEAVFKRALQPLKTD